MATEVTTPRSISEGEGEDDGDGREVRNDRARAVSIC
jgi:hypothetical protein